jgi:hypothetical protein
MREKGGWAVTHRMERDKKQQKHISQESAMQRSKEIFDTMTEEKKARTSGLSVSFTLTHLYIHQ